MNAESEKETADLGSEISGDHRARQIQQIQVEARSPKVKRLAEKLARLFNDAIPQGELEQVLADEKLRYQALRQMYGKDGDAEAIVGAGQRVSAKLHDAASEIEGAIKLLQSNDRFAHVAESHASDISTIKDVATKWSLVADTYGMALHASRRAPNAPLEGRSPKHRHRNNNLADLISLWVDRYYELTGRVPRWDAQDPCANAIRELADYVTEDTVPWKDGVQRLLKQAAMDLEESVAGYKEP